MKNYTVNKMDILAALFWIMIMGFYTPYQAIYYVYQATIAIVIFIVAFSIELLSMSKLMLQIQYRLLLLW